MTQYAVIDCETTGFGKNDRIIEVAVAILDGSSLDIVHEFDTLLNPGRDVGRTDIHGITPHMLGAAPTFDEISSGLSKCLHGSVLVAHNLPFDSRMLQQECNRAGLAFDCGNGVCTYRLSRSKLDVAATAMGISLTSHHRALSDVRTAAQIFKSLHEGCNEEVAARMIPKPGAEFCRTLRREATGSLEAGEVMRRLLGRACYPSSDDRVQAYFDMLDWALSDGVLADDEKTRIEGARSELGLNSKQIVDLHKAYLQSVAAAVRRDSRVTENEARLFSRVSKMLGLGEAKLETSARPDRKTEMKLGSRVCFTGAAMDLAGNPIERATLEQCAAAAGLQPVKSVTKQGCDFLVAVDPDSMSGKAKQASKWGIPVMSVREFLAAVG